MPKKIISVVGARPNFMKIAPIINAFHELKPWRNSLEHILVHTGQHFSESMSDLLFSQLGIPEPDINLAISGGNHGEQTGRIMIEFEKVVMKLNPDAVLVVGDVNSTLAASLVASKLGVKIIHVEAGLRSGDLTMPEEVNRVLTDRLSDFLFVTEKTGLANLEKEGVDSSKVHFVGNVMIDTLLRQKNEFIKEESYRKYGLSPRKYLLVTLHRPSNVDDLQRLSRLLVLFERLSEVIDILLPLHPRTEAKIRSLQRYESLSSNSKIILTGPLGYNEFMSLMFSSAGVLTDSGGVQEETTILKVPCFTARKNTERPVTITKGSNKLLSWNEDKMFDEILSGLTTESTRAFETPELWDGQAAQRIVKILENAI